ncbi:MAG: 2-oxo acid dehydrogenase subunit E2 [Chloroflexota bacterium]|nr:2-oxo acid dehydrogenase subunit E2 [Chloroflexota bacterium]
MATEVKMPKLGIDMVDGSIARWLKSEGDQVEKEEPIAEVETDKSTVEMEAPESGVLLRILVAEDEIVPVGEVLAYIGEQGESVPETGDGAAATAAKAEGVEEREEVPEGEEGEAEDAREVQKEMPDGARMPSLEAEPQPTEAPEGEAVPPGGVKASPVARRMAEELGYDLTQIQGTGPGGRVVSRDVEAYRPEKAPAAPEAKPAEAPAPPGAPSVPAAPRPTPIGEAEEEELSRMRKRITEVLTASKWPVPHFYVTMDVDMEAAVALRREMNETLADEGIKISFNDLVVKAAALALKKFPNLNASFAGDKIIKHGDINVGIAVATPTGLMTVATRNTDKLALSELSQITRERANRAREGRIKPQDIGETTFTVSNLGMYGVDSFVAIITPPEAAILAVGGIQEEPVVKNGEIVIGHRMKATISADHRVTDGAEAAEYMVELKRLLENPMRLML